MCSPSFCRQRGNEEAGQQREPRSSGVATLPPAASLSSSRAAHLRCPPALSFHPRFLSTCTFHLHPHPQAEGFSQPIVDRFFRPFLGGIFFDRSLATSSRLFSFVMRMLATGERRVCAVCALCAVCCVCVVCVCAHTCVCVLCVCVGACVCVVCVLCVVGVDGSACGW